jgi:hypothetical protein
MAEETLLGGVRQRRSVVRDSGRGRYQGAGGTGVGSLRLSANNRSTSNSCGPAHVTMAPAGLDSVRLRQGESTEESPTCTTSGWR